jgi:RecA-family ATPase
MSFLGTSSGFIHKNRPTDLFQRLLDGLKDKEPSDGWSLIILDPISRFAGASAETDNASATELIALLERLSLELRGRPTVLFGHHMNKTGIGNHSTDQGASRGSSALTDGVRLQINLDRGEQRENEPETVTLRVVKSNFTSIPHPMTLIKDSVGCLRKKPEKRMLEKKCASMPHE